MGRSLVRSAAFVYRSLIVSACALSPLATAQGPQSDATAIGPVDSAEVEAFFDRLIESQMEQFHIAGAAVAVVKDGTPLLLNGYGHADLEKGVEVDPEKTLFRIASITKSFTATAVMQLVERGLLDLDVDVNEYLDFRIPATFDEPVTLRHLLTHTAGFEDQFYDVLVLDERAMVPAGEWLQSHMPARVRPPGTAAAYSNYGFGLAGYIVERVSGQTFAEYLREHVLAPLGMDRTTAFPFTEEQLAAESRGYRYEGSEFIPTPYYLGQPAHIPAGGLLSTASDMARYMNMHLQEGGYLTRDGVEGRSLGAESARLMHSTQYAGDPRLLGTGLGLFDFSDNGQLTLGHSGDAYPTSSLMLLLPELRLGMFVAYNSEGAADLVNQHLGFQRAVFDHYFPPATADTPVPVDTSVDTSRLVGHYRLSRGSYTTFEKVAALFGTVALTSSGPGTLAMDTPWGVFDFGAVEPLYFRQDGGPFALVFREDEQGRISHMFTDLTPMYAFERLRWYETPTFTLVLLVVCVAAFLSVVAVGVRRTVQRPGGRGGSPSLATEPMTAVWVERNASSVAERMMLAVASLALFFIIGLAIWFNPVPLFGVPVGLEIVLGFGVLLAVLTVGAVAVNVLAWKYGYWSLGARLHYSVATLAAVAFVWLLNNWNLLGWRY